MVRKIYSCNLKFIRKVKCELRLIVVSITILNEIPKVIKKEKTFLYTKQINPYLELFSLTPNMVWMLTDVNYRNWTKVVSPFCANLETNG